MSSLKKSKLSLSVTVIYKDKDGKEIHYPVTKKRTTIGRITPEVQCNLQLPDPYISRHHCDLIIQKDNTLWVFDRQSTNGVFLRPAEPLPPELTPKLLRWNDAFLVRGKVQLHNKDILLLGNTELQVVIEEIMPADSP